MRNFALGVGLLWALCAGFAFGVFVRSLTAVPDWTLFGLGALALMGLCAAAAYPRHLRLAIIFAAALIACGAGVLRMQSALLVYDPLLDARIGERVTFEGVVADAPDNRATQVRVPIRLASSSVQAMAVFSAHTDLYYGERVRVTGTLVLPSAFDTGGGREFNYPGYLASQGILYQLDRAELESGSGFEGNSLVAGAFALKDYFVAGLESSLPEPHAGLAGGITVGEKRALGKDLAAEFQIVSLMHIVVLSGYNITVVIDWLFRVLHRAPRYVRFGAGGLVALFFAVMTGFASASLRAALMALIVVSGKLSGRLYRADRALVLVGTLMLVWNPYLLVFDPGFQLSFLACMGLIVFSPIFARLFVRVTNILGLKDILVSTSSAQVAVLPILLYGSGSLSLVSLPANLLALAVVPYTMFFSAVAALGGMFFAPVAPLVGVPALLLLSYILSIAHMLSNVPYAALPVPAFSAWGLMPVYALLFGGAYYLLHRGKSRSASG